MHAHRLQDVNLQHDQATENGLSQDVCSVARIPYDPTQES